MLLALCSRRCYSTLKRTIPYITKGNWKLPPIISGDSAKNNPELATSEWGNRVSNNGGESAVNVPHNWRKIRTIPQWKKQMFSLKEKFPEGWKPQRKLSREEMDELRSLKTAKPQMNLSELGSMFRISPEAARRIVKSKWRASPETEVKLRERWIRRGVRLGSHKVKTQRKEPKKLRDPGNDLF